MSQKQKLAASLSIPIVKEIEAIEEDLKKIGGRRSFFEGLFETLEEVKREELTAHRQKDEILEWLEAHPNIWSDLCESPVEEIADRFRRNCIRRNIDYKTILSKTDRLANRFDFVSLITEEPHQNGNGANHVK